MSDIAISVENLGKSYLVGHQAERERYVALRDVIGRSARNLARKTGDLLRGRQIVQGDEVEEFWALKGVSFEVKQGEVLGIIGRNGAGKSTLLKILSRITEPTAGRAILRGRVASLLEVGTGFHPELTGRENIFLNGAVLGMTKAEVRKKFDEIVAFAEVERFLDTPVKRYSSGMYVRLAFAVAAHLEPEILVVDEVLSVGDAEFQKRCLGKMHNVVSEQGRTVLFVSHNMVAVQSLSDRCIVLSRGQLLCDDKSDKAIGAYLGEMGYTASEQIWKDRECAPGNEKVRLARIAIIPENQERSITMKTDFRIELDYCVQTSSPLLHTMYHLYNERGILVLTTADRSMGHEPGIYRSICSIPGSLLNAGGYFLKLQIVENNFNHVYAHDNIASFEVIDVEPRTSGWMGKEPGVVQPIFPWNTHKLSELNGAVAQ
jgi:lipopolysaccharide transport system ATP-binding protein